MKDAAHHLKHIQKKVIQAARKESNEEYINNNHTSTASVEYQFIPAKKRRKALNRLRHSMSSTL